MHNKKRKELHWKNKQTVYKNSWLSKSRWSINDSFIIYMQFQVAATYSNSGIGIGIWSGVNHWLGNLLGKDIQYICLHTENEANNVFDIQRAASIRIKRVHEVFKCIIHISDDPYPTTHLYRVTISLAPDTCVCGSPSSASSEALSNASRLSIDTFACFIVPSFRNSNIQ